MNAQDRFERWGAFRSLMLRMRGVSWVLLVLVAAIVGLGWTFVAKESLTAHLARLTASSWPVPAFERAGVAPSVLDVLDAARTDVLSDRSSHAHWYDYAALLHAHALDAAAMEAYRRAGQLRPDDPRVPYLRALLGPSTGLDVDERLRLYRRAAELDPRYPPTWLRMGQLLADDGREQEALAALQHAVELDPSYPMAHRQLGLTLLEAKDLAGALLHLEFAAELVEDDYPTWAGLARAFQQAGRQEEAAAAALRSEPLIEVMNYRDGVLDAVLALGVGPLRMDRLAAGYERAGAWRAALEALKSVERARPEDPTIQRRLSLVYEALDEKALAAVHLRRAERLEGASIDASVDSP